MNFLNISLIGIWIVLIVQSIIIFYLSKYVASFLNSFRLLGGNAVALELPIGEKAPLFRERDQHYKEIKLSDNNGKYTLLFFAGRDCMYCKMIIPKLHIILKYIGMRIIVISQQQLDINTEIPDINFIVSEELFESYRVKVVPMIFLIDSKGYLVLKEMPKTFHALTILLGRQFQTNIDYDAS